MGKKQEIIDKSFAKYIVNKLELVESLEKASFEAWQKSGRKQSNRDTAKYAIVYGYAKNDFDLNITYNHKPLTNTFPTYSTGEDFIEEYRDLLKEVYLFEPKY